MKNASPEQIKQISMGNMDALLDHMKEAKEHIVTTMLCTADREALPEFRSEAKTLHELISLIESAPDTSKQIYADSVPGSASPGDLS